MRRSAGHQPLLVRYALPIAVVILLLLTLLPTRSVRFVGWLQRPVRVVVFPVSGPLRALSGYILPAGGPAPGDADLREYQLEVERLNTELLRKDAEIDRLQAIIAELQGGRSLPLASRYDPYRAPVVGVSSDLRVLQVRAGRNQGVHQGAVATHGVLQLLGRVEEAAATVSRVRPITDRAAGKIGGVVMATPDGSRTLDTLLTPTENGALVGEVAHGGDPNQGEIEVRPGMIVRLRDENWPRGLWMLRIGVVTEVTTAPDSALRRRIVVRPGEDLNRPVSLRDVSEVILWTPRQDQPRTPDAGGAP